jgi:hypothetical protein
VQWDAVNPFCGTVCDGPVDIITKTPSPAPQTLHIHVKEFLVLLIIYIFQYVTAACGKGKGCACGGAAGSVHLSEPDAALYGVLIS